MYTHAPGLHAPPPLLDDVLLDEELLDDELLDVLLAELLLPPPEQVTGSHSARTTSGVQSGWLVWAWMHS
jgi:hypothetical protein